jgi:hypothetical protein
LSYPDKTKSSGISTTWKGGGLLLSPTKQSSKKSLKEKAQDWSIGIGTKHATTLLDELHDNDFFSTSWDWERLSKSVPH